MNLAIALGRPLLLQGDPGCGKTRLAYAVAYTLQLPSEECYIKSTSQAQDLLYAYDAVNRLYDSQLKETQSREALRDLCCALWAKSYDEQETLRSLFDQLRITRWILPDREPASAPAFQKPPGHLLAGA